MQFMKSELTPKASMQLKDRIILYHLDSNSRMSSIQIAKRARLRKETVAFRMRKMDMVKRYFAICDSTLLGYTNYKIYIKFKSMNKVLLKKFHDYMLSLPELSFLAYCSGRFDCAAAFWVKNSQEFNDIVFRLLSKFSRQIESKEIVANARWFICNRKYLVENYKPVAIEFGNSNHGLKLDDLDHKIVSILNENARTKILDIAHKAKASSPVVIQRIKRMQNLGYIKLFTYDLDLDKAGMEFAKVLVTLQDVTLESTGKLLQYCKNHPHVRSIIHVVGPWDLELEFEIKNFRQLSDIIYEMRSSFPIIRNTEALMFSAQHVKNFVPIRH